MKEIHKFPYVIVLTIILLSILAISIVIPPELFILMTIIMIFMIFSIFIYFKLSYTSLYYIYIGQMFYSEYIKLLFPTIFIRLIPDALFILLVFKCITSDYRGMKNAVINKNNSISNIIVVSYLVVNMIEIFNPLLPSIYLGMQGFRNIFKILVMYWLSLYVLDSESKINKFIKFVGINIFIIFIFSFKQIIFGFSSYELAVHCPPPIRRVYSFLGNAAVFSVIMGIGALALYLRSILTRKIFPLLLGSCYFIVSSLSLHRSPLFASIFVIVAVNIFVFKELFSFIITKSFQLVIVVLLISIGIYLLISTNYEGKIALIRDEVIYRSTSFIEEKMGEASIQTRIKQLFPAESVIKYKPFGLGIGYTLLSGEQSMNMGLYRYLPRYYTGSYDNSFLTVYLETGWFGLILFVAFIFYGLITNAARLVYSKTNTNVKFTLILIFGSSIIVAISSITGSIFFVQVIGSLFTVGMAISQNLYFIGTGINGQTKTS